MGSDIIITVSLTPKEALAFAQFLKRVGYNNYYENAVSEEETYTMIEAGEKIRNELSKAGFAPR